MLGEGLAICTAVLFSCWMIMGSDGLLLSRLPWFKVFLISFVSQICLYYNDLYDLKVTDNLSKLTIRLLQSLGSASIFLAVIYYVFPQAIIGRGIFAISIGFVILLIVSWRFCYMLVIEHGLFNQKIMVVGSGGVVQDIVKEINEKKDCGYTVLAIVPEDEENGAPALSDKRAIFYSSYDGLCEMAKQLEIKKIIVGLREKRGALPTKELLKCRVEGIDVLTANSFYEMLTGKLIVEQINPGWLIFSEGFQKSRFRQFLKRLVDLFCSCIIMVLLSPVLFLVSILIKLDSKGPVFFSQERVGQNRKSYMVYKFRSMIVDAEMESGPVWAQDDDCRTTRVGKFIRKWRIDEIPQIWNVLKGEMSLVGPRPEREHFVKELEKIIPYYGERFTVKPGLTGWAQVSYGYGASVEDAVEKLNYDLFYIKNMSLLMDLMIVLRTVKTVIFSKGAR